jgi:chemotaxis protein methyltransferase CheR
MGGMVDDDAELCTLLATVTTLTGMDLRGYKPAQVRRRLLSLMARHGCQGFADYARVLETSPEALRQFCARVTINVSELFRNPDTFEQLKEEYLRPLVRRFGELTVWSAGCANGAEIYSVAMQLSSIGPLMAHRLLATDVDRAILARAAEGRFAPADVRHVPPALLRRHTRRDGEDYIVAPGLRARVEFEHHDLLVDPFPRGIHLVLCRNVVIYFTDEAKDGLYRRFFESLIPGGALFLGGTERIPNARQIGFETPSPFFYVRSSGTPTRDQRPAGPPP